MASLRLPLFALAGLLTGPAFSQSTPVRDKNVEARLVASVSTIQPGVPFTLGLQFTIDRTWHTYWANPGDTGIKVWKTRFGTIGVGICWDQWFPECARSMALLGAEILFYPTAIGSEPHDPAINSREHWQRVQQGHAGANLMPLVASNRIGKEEQDDFDITFYGSSFIADQFGKKVEELNETEEGILVHSFDLTELEKVRSAWGTFRDRRPNLYGAIATLDGVLKSE